MADLCGTEFSRQQPQPQLSRLLCNRGDLGWHVLLHPHALLNAHLHICPHHGHAVAPQQDHGRGHAIPIFPLPHFRRPHRIRHHQLQHHRPLTYLLTPSPSPSLGTIYTTRATSTTNPALISTQFTTPEQNTAEFYELGQKLKTRQ